jgi:hypothetical protein
MPRNGPDGSAAGHELDDQGAPFVADEPVLPDGRGERLKGKAEVVELASVVRTLPELEQLGVRRGGLAEPDSGRHQIGKLLLGDN